MISARSTAQEWDTVRAAFATSIMVDTAMSSLAQNLDGPDWPLKGPQETPAAYIDLSYDEAVELLALKGQPAERMDQLVAILRDTLAFDDPFGEMVAQSEAASERDNPLLKNLAKLEIPENFPIEFTALSKETLEFCALEKLSTLGEFSVFAQSMAQTVVVGGDFRSLLNALSHVDERAIAAYLPFRPGSRGLHLIESVAMAARSLGANVPRLAADRTAPVPPQVIERVARLVGHFAPEAAVLRARITSGTSIVSLVGVLNDPATEAVVARLLDPHLSPPVTVATKKPSWWSRLFGK